MDLDRIEPLLEKLMLKFNMPRIDGESSDHCDLPDPGYPLRRDD